MKNHRGILSSCLVGVVLAPVVAMAQAPVEKVDAKPYRDAVQKFADAVLEHGRDHYGEVHTPLFADGLHAQTLEPVIWLWADGDQWILCNFANQQALMRLLDGLTGLTGDSRYRQAAEEATAYILANAQSPSGLLYWGGHSAWDLGKDRPVGTFTGREDARGQIRMNHELKANQPYYDLLWRVNPDATRKLLGAIWQAHITNWATLDFNRHGKTWISHKPPAWDSPFDADSPVPFTTDSKNRSFAGVIPPFLSASTALVRLDDHHDALVWSERMAQQWQRSRHPTTGLSGGQLSWSTVDDRAINALGHVHPQINETNIVASYHASGRYHRLPLAQMQFGEELIAKGGESARVGQAFIAWASDDLKAYVQVYDKSRGLFIPQMTDGTPLDISTLKPGYYIPEDFLPWRPDGNLFWGYAKAYRLTGEQTHWDMLRQMGNQLSLGDLGQPDGVQRNLAVANAQSMNPWVIYGLLELHQATGDARFLQLAARVGDNIIAIQTTTGLFPRPAAPPQEEGVMIGHSEIPGLNRPARVHARTGDEMPLALLHLAAAIDGKRNLLPKALPDEQYFHCPYRGPLEPYQKKRADNRTYDWLVFYGEDLN